MCWGTPRNMLLHPARSGQARTPCPSCTSNDLLRSGRVTFGFQVTEYHHTLGLHFAGGKPRTAPRLHRSQTPDSFMQQVFNVYLFVWPPTNILHTGERKRAVTAMTTPGMASTRGLEAPHSALADVEVVATSFNRHALLLLQGLGGKMCRETGLLFRKPRCARQSLSG